MTAPAPLTDDELADIEQVYGTEEPMIRRLIADLRAARERIKELEKEVEMWKDEHWHEVDY